jgi:hypothetical protein
MSAAARIASAQAAANAAVNANAFVSGIAPLSVGAANQLLFGTLAAGLTRSPVNLASDAGRFLISGQPNQPVFLDFVLPTVLTSPASVSIPITFGATDGLLWTAFPLTHTTFDPNASFFTALGVTGNLLIGISGTVAPPPGTPTGFYIGTITMTVSY